VKDQSKTKNQLIEELINLRQRVTELEKAGNRLKQEDEELRADLVWSEVESHRSKAIIESMGDGISIQDRHFKVLYQNQVHKDLIGEHIGEYCYEAYEKREDVCEGCPVASAFEDGKFHMAERSAVVGKRPLSVEIAASPLRDSKGDIIAGIEIVRNITGRTKNEEELRKQQNHPEEQVSAHTVYLKDIIEDLRQEITVRMEAEKRASELYNELKTVFEHLPVGIVYLDDQFKLISANRFFYEITGLGEDELIGRPCYDTVGEHAGDSTKQGLDKICSFCRKEECFETKKPTVVEREMGDRTVRVTAIPELDDQGEIYHFMELFEDITERTRVEAELQKRASDLNERVKELHCLFNISNLIMKPGVTLEEIYRGTVEFVRSAWQYPEIACARIVWQGAEFKTDNFKKTAWCQSSDIMVNGKPVGSLEICYLQEMPECDEGPFLKEESSLLNAISQRLARTAEKSKAERLLSESEEKFRVLSHEFHTVLDAIHDGLLLLSPELKVLWANTGAATILEKEISDIVGQYCFELWEDSTVSCENCHALKSFRDGRPFHAQFSTREGLLLDASAFPILDEDLKVNTVVMVYRDITEKLTLQAEAMRAGHLASLGELAAGVAHEINNPANGIINYAQILADRSQPGSKENEIAGEIIEEGHRIARIVKSLLSFARDRREEKRPVYIYKILARTLALTERLLQKNGVHLIKYVPEDLPPVLANAQQIQQVFLNIINNAQYALNTKYPGTDEDKILEIFCEKVIQSEQPHLRITFYDRGTGIPYHFMDKVMNPFFSTKPGGQGTGLGLSISHGIISDHSGRLLIDSVEDEYTKVIIEIPSLAEESG
jgi:PAS domain S-box-containing protein